jgi:hypothetical protein
MNELILGSDIPGKERFQDGSVKIPDGLVTDTRLSIKARLIIVAILSAQQYYDVEQIPEKAIEKFVCEYLDITPKAFKRCIKEINETEWLKSCEN